MLWHAPLAALGLLALLAACGPISVQQAEDQCFETARQARNPLAGSKVGMGSAGFTGELKLTVSSDFVQGRDPSAVYDSCVFSKSGQPPTRPLYDRPDWR